LIGLARKIISDSQLYQAEANDDGLLISYDSGPIAKFEENKITISTEVRVEGSALSLYDPAQLVYKGYVDSLNSDMLVLLGAYRTIADSYSILEVDTAISDAVVPYRLIADSYTQAEVDALIAGVSGGGGG